MPLVAFRNSARLKPVKPRLVAGGGLLRSGLVLTWQLLLGRVLWEGEVLLATEVEHDPPATKLLCPRAELMTPLASHQVTRFSPFPD